MEAQDNPAALKPAAFVRVIQNADGAALLDIHHGVCFSLNPVGLRIWNLLKAETSVNDIATSLALELQVPRPQVFQDVAEFMNALKEKRLLRAALPESRLSWLARQVHLRHSSLHRGHPRRGRSMRFLALKAFVGLLSFDLLGLGNDFPSTYALVRDWANPPAVPTAAAIAERVCSALNSACVWYPKRIQCLQRSAVTTCLLRNCGVRAQMVMGAQKSPFRAHAWTEVDGNAINERRDVKNSYLVWERC